MMAKKQTSPERLKAEARKILQVQGPLTNWAKQCHVASLHVVRALGGRVARGWCRGVRGQHSWAVIGPDCYSLDAVIVDPTLWSYDAGIKGIWVGTMRDGLHKPHGLGSIWAWGKPPSAVELPVELDAKLSKDAQEFLKLCGPLDRAGWHFLATAPVQGWPAGEILAAMADTSALAALVPIDRLGMLTDRNPGGLYLGRQL